MGWTESPIYVDQFTRLNRDVYEQALDLYGTRGKTVEAEAELCLGLFSGFAATIFTIMVISSNTFSEYWTVVGKSFLNYRHHCSKVRLLTYCYSEVYDKELAQEAHAIINTWDQSQLTLEQVEIIEDLKNFEENQYSHEAIE